MTLKQTKKHYLALTVLNLMALPVTAYLTYLHYKPDASEICNISEAFNCGIVNKSIYSEIFGIPVAILGFLFYLAFLIFSIRGLKKDQTKWIPHATLATLAGTLFALYLTAIETFVLYTYCLFCVIQQIIILVELGIITHLWKKTRKKS